MNNLFLVCEHGDCMTSGVKEYRRKRSFLRWILSRSYRRDWSVWKSEPVALCPRHAVGHVPFEGPLPPLPIEAYKEVREAYQKGNES